MNNTNLPSIASLAVVALFSSNPGIENWEVFLQRHLIDAAESNAIVDIAHHTPAGPFFVKWLRGHTQRYDFLLGSFYTLHFKTYFLNSDIDVKAVGLLNNFFIIKSSI